jgi:hypothetical protein
MNCLKGMDEYMSGITTAATAPPRGNGLLNELPGSQGPGSLGAHGAKPNRVGGTAATSAVEHWEEARIPVVGEAAFAAWQEELGHRVIGHRGRYWVEVGRGFFQPVHPLARLRRDEATRPTRRCWGFRARLTPEDELHADASIPVHLLPDPQSYSLQRLSGRRRRYVRVSLRDFDIVVLASPDILIDQGYRLAEEAHAHNHNSVLPTPGRFRRKIESNFVPGRGLALAALRHDRLLGFTLIYAVDGVAYEHSGRIGREGLDRNVRLCLFHAVASIAQWSPGIHELMNGFHAREAESLCAFKQDQGCEVVQLPARAWFASPIEPVLRRMRPHEHYRLAGLKRSGAAGVVPAARSR